MARSAPDTATNEFFICVGDQPELDFGGKRNPDGQGFAAFGRVVRGMDVVKKIQMSPGRRRDADPDDQDPQRPPRVHVTGRPLFTTVSKTLLNWSTIMLKVTSVALLALLSLSPPQTQSDEIAALKKEVQALRAQQTAMERDLQTIKALLQNLAGQRPAQPSGPPVDPFANKTIAVSNERSKGNAGAKMTLVEVSDYHCPFCRRQTLQTLPQLMTEYVNSGKARYVFVDYPIAQLHPTRSSRTRRPTARGTRANTGRCTKACSPTRRSSDVEQLTAQAKRSGSTSGSSAPE